MSTIAAAIGRDGAWMATDAMRCGGDRYKLNVDVPKLVEPGLGYMVGMAGDGRAHDLIAKGVYSGKAPVIEDWDTTMDWYGWARELLIQNGMKPQSDREGKLPDTGLWFLAMTRTQIFSISPNGSVTKRSSWWAAGHGQEFALGSLFAGERSAWCAKAQATNAVLAACHLDIWTGGRVMARRIK